MLRWVKRLFWLAAGGGAGFVGYSAWRRRGELTDSPAAPQWPPFEPAAAPTDAQPLVATAATTSTTATSTTATSTTATSTTATASPVATADAERARWVAPIDGRCPSGYPIKANDSSHIFHMPGGRFYERTVPERCYADAADAEADGYRRAKA